MEDADRIRELAGLLASKAEQATTAELSVALEKLTGVYKASADVEKAKAEIRKLEIDAEKARYDLEHTAKTERLEARQRYITLLTPLITTFLLISTLIFQAVQFVRSERDKQEAADAAQWADVVKDVAKSTDAPPLGIILSPFLNSRQYSERARKIIVQVLGTPRNASLFDGLFRSAFVPVQWSNLQDVLQLDRSLTSRANELALKTYNVTSRTNDDRILTPEEKRDYDYSFGVFQEVGNQIAPLLRSARPKNQVVDLRSVWFSNCDWTGVDLSHANLQNSDFRFVLLRGADLSGIDNPSYLYMYGTAWWEAARISPALLSYLKQTYPYDPELSYGPAYKHITRQEYETALGRIESANQRERIAHWWSIWTKP